MAEEAAVVLKGIDELSGPALKAIAALKQLEAQAKKVADTGSTVAKGAKVGTDGIGLMEVMASKRFEHVGMRMMLGQIADITNASPAASRSLGMVSTAMSGLMVASGPVGITLMAVAAAVTLGTMAWNKHAEAQKKANEQYEKSIASLKSLTTSQADSARQSLVQAKATLQNLEAQLLIEQQTGTWREAFIRWSGTAIESIMSVVRAIIALGKAFLHPIDAFKTLTDLWVSAKGKLADALDAPTKRAIELQQQIDNLKNSIANTTPVVDAMTSNAVSKFQDMLGVVVSVSKIIGEVMGNVIVGVQEAWKVGVKSLIGVIVDMAIKMVTINIAAAKTVAAAWAMAGGPAGMLLMAGKIAAIAALGAVAIGALSKTKTESAPSAAISSVSPASTAAATTGGAAVSTAQKEVVNNITVNMPIQALDLAAISDTQLKSLSFRVGKMLREASATGQFSLT